MKIIKRNSDNFIVIEENDVVNLNELLATSDNAAIAQNTLVYEKDGEIFILENLSDILGNENTPVLIDDKQIHSVEELALALEQSENVVVKLFDSAGGGLNYTGGPIGAGLNYHNLLVYTEFGSSNQPSLNFSGSALNSFGEGSDDDSDDDDGPIVPIGTKFRIANVTVDESGLANGTNASANTEIATGSFTLHQENGNITGIINGVTVVKDGKLVNDTIVTDKGVLTITSFDPDTGELTWQYELSDNQDHSNNQKVTDILEIEVIYSDGTSEKGNAIITVLDDAPILTSSTVTVAVDEDALADANADSLNGNQQSVISGSLESLVVPGADGVVFELKTDTSGLPEVTSGGEAVTYVVDPESGTLTATDSEGNPVFILTVNEDGSFTFEVLGPVDQAEQGEDSLNIDFSSILKVVDGDGDTIEDFNDGSFTVDVVDDIPVANENVSVALVADEDSLSDSNTDTGADGENSYTQNLTGNISSLVNFGADGNGSFSINKDTSGLPALTSGGENIIYTVTTGTDGNGNPITILTATTETSGETVFTLSVTEDGDVSLELLGPIDQPEGDGENSSILDLSSAIVATDGDGDTLVLPENSLTMEIGDDIPVDNDETITLVADEDSLSTGNTDIGEDGENSYTQNLTANISSLVDFGVDGAGIFEINTDTSGLPALTSAGENIIYTVTTGTDANGNPITILTATTETSGETVFTLSVTEGGDVSLELLAPIDQPEGDGENSTTLDLSAAIVAADGDGDPIVLDAGSLEVEIGDDQPIADDSQTLSLEVDEDGLSTANTDNGETGEADYGGNTTASGNVASFVDFGADGAGIFEINTDTSGLPALTSGGENIIYTVTTGTDGNGNPITILTTTTETSGETVFTLSVTEAGDVSLELLGPIDHAEGDGENSTSLDLSAAILAVDADGDAVPLKDGQLTIDIGDDQPIADDSQSLSLEVDEDGLSTGNTDNGETGEADYGESTTASGNIASFVDFGADGAGIFEINTDTSGLPVLTSGGENIIYTVTTGTDANGNPITILTATTETSGETVFTLSVTEAGDVSLELLAPIDHAEGDGENSTSLDLSTAILAVDTDGDAVPLKDGQLTIDIGDDQPIGNDKVVELVADEDSLSTGNTDSGQTGEETYSEVLTGDLTTVVDFGADGAGSFAINTDTSGLPALTSGGEALSYVVSSDGQTITAQKADGTVILTLNVAEDGAVSLELLGPIDHANGDGENSTTLDLSAAIVVTDTDGDAMVLDAGSLEIEIGDDIPTLSTATVTGEVDEDGLSAANADSDNGNQQLTATGSLSSLVNAGADGISFTLKDDTSVLPTVKSGGEDVVYTIDTAAGTITAKDINGNEVFVLTINDDGSYEFELKGAVDHSTDGEDTLTIDFSSIVSAVDGDGDTIDLNTSSFTIDIVDDIPVRTDAALVELKVDEDGLSGANTDSTPLASGEVDYGGLVTATGDLSSLYSYGADGAGSFAINSDTSTLPSLTSGGDALSYVVSNDGQTLSAQKADGTVIFTLTITTDGDVSFELKGPLDHDDGNGENELSLDLSSAIVVTDGDGDFIVLSDNILNIQVGDDQPELDYNVELTVDEDALPTAVTDTGLAGENNATNPIKFVEADLDVGNAAGADGGDFGFASDYAIVLEALGLTVWGVDLSYSLNGDTITATANGTDIFTISLDTSGHFEFELFHAIDHNDTSGEDTLNLDLSNVISLFDNDNDPASGGSLIIHILDDQPIIDTSATLSLEVDEDGLSTANTDNGSSGENDYGASTTASGSLASAVNFGADGAGSFAINSDTSTLPSLTSGGDALSYVVSSDGQTLSAQKADGTVIFTLTITTDGAVSFELNGPLDHATANGENELSLDLSSAITVTDADGDTVILPSGQISIEIGDDQPIRTDAASVELNIDEDGLSGANNDSNPLANGEVDYGGLVTATADLSGLYSYGADGAGNFAINSDTSTLPSLTSGGDTLSYVVSSDGQTLSAQKADGTVIFTLTITEAGTVSFELNGPLDHATANGENELSLDLSSAIIVTDADGDSVSLDNSLIINVGDDILDTADDIVDFTAQTDDYVTIDFLDNDNMSIDGIDSVTFELDDGTILTWVQLEAGYDIEGGTISLDTDGNLRFDVTSPYETIDFTVDYTVTDSDGDTSTSTMTFNKLPCAVSDNAQTVQYAVEQPFYHIAITLDISGSMGYNDGGVSRLHKAKEALINLINTYVDRFGAENVDFSLITFSRGAQLRAEWVDATTVTNIINNLVANGNTYYDDAQDAMIDLFTDLPDQPVQEDEYVSYFISDGEANAGHHADYTLWDSELGSDVTDLIDFYSIGVGGGVTAGDDDLEAMANLDSQGNGDGEVIIVDDFDDLLDVLEETIGGVGVEGNVFYGSDGIEGTDDDDDFASGAADPAIINVEYLDENDVWQTVAVSGAVDNVLTFTLPKTDGTFTLNIQTGEWTYTNEDETAEALEQVRYTIENDQGETSTAILEVNVEENDYDPTSVLYNDSVITSFTGEFYITKESLSYNDDEQSVDLHLVGSPSNVSESGYLFYYNGTSGFTYEREETAATDASVSVVRDTSGSLDGTASDDIIISNNNSETVLAGAGNDWIEGRGGDDTLAGGTGSDVFAYVDTSDGDDTIVDFTIGTEQDYVDLTMVFDDLGIANYSRANHVNLTQNDTDAVVTILDADSNEITDFSITLENIDIADIDITTMFILNNTIA